MLTRWQGAVVGQALGDALGFVVEGYSPRECAAYVEGCLRGRVEALARPGFEAGQYTDDTQLLRELLQSVAARGAWDPADYGARVAAIFTEGRIVGRGRATELAAVALAAGTPWQEAGTPAPSAGNGSAMRAAGAALVAGADDALRARIAWEQGRVTHQDPRCAAGSAAVAAAVARGLRGAPVAVEAFCAEVADAAAAYDAGFAELVRERLPAWVALAPGEAARAIGALGAAPEVGDAWHGISPFVVPSVTWSLCAFLRTPDDYWETICAAIAVGGDVDTTAAMAGAISGAHLGLEALPAELARGVHDRGTWGHDALCDLAAKIHDASSAPVR